MRFVLLGGIKSRLFFHWPPPFSLTRLDLIAWTQVHAINAVLIRSDARQAATSPAIGKYCVGHSPTRKKNRELTRLNRETDSPINSRHYLLYTYLTRGAHMGTHVCSLCRVALRHVAAPCASCAPHGPLPACHVAFGPSCLRAMAHLPRVASTVSPLATSAPR